jgi:hypothetical protein
MSHVPSHWPWNILSSLVPSRPAIRKALVVAVLLIGTTAGAAIMAGQFSFASVPAKPLINSMKVAQGVKSFGFASSIGGVAFGAVAVPSDGSRITALTYVPEKPDGKRLVATVRKDGRDREVTVPSYDWLFVPVAKFANGRQDALFTFFGKLTDEADERRRTVAGQRILNYHPAIQNTFLGLRLMQADLLAFHQLGPENLTENGEVLKAPGETPREVERNKRDIATLNRIYQSGKAQSYVISDVDGAVSMRLVSFSGNDTLEFQGRPYWACWRLKGDQAADMRGFLGQPSTRKKVQKAVMDRLKREGQRPGLDGIPSAEFKKQIEEIAKEESFKAWHAHVDATLFEQLPDLSRRLSDKMEELEGGNPPVYRALRSTMYQAAFFRHVQKANPRVYARFMEQLEGVVPQPTAQTPTVLIPPGK